MSAWQHSAVLSLALKTMDIPLIQGLLRAESPQPTGPARFIFVSTAYSADDEKALIHYEADPRVYDSEKKITLSYRRNESAPESLENQLLDSDADRDEKIMDVFMEIFPRISHLCDTVTGVRIQTIDGELSVTVYEDVDELIPYPPIPPSLSHIATVRISEIQRIFGVSMDVDRVKWQGWTYAFKKTGENFNGTLRELALLDALSSSPYVIDLHAIVVGQNNTVRGFLMPFMRIGDLEHVFRTVRGAVDDLSVVFDWPVKLSWAREITHAVVDMHEISAYNGDLKPQNVLLDAKGHALLIDFLPAGISDGYAAPEVLEKCHTDVPFETVLTASADIYSLGLVLWAVAEEDWRAARSPVWRDATPVWYRDIVARCLLVDADLRPSAVEVLALLMKEGL